MSEKLPGRYEKSLESKEDGQETPDTRRSLSLGMEEVPYWKPNDLDESNIRRISCPLKYPELSGLRIRTPPCLKLQHWIPGLEGCPNSVPTLKRTRTTTDCWWLRDRTNGVKEWLKRTLVKELFNERILGSKVPDKVSSDSVRNNGAYLILFLKGTFINMSPTLVYVDSLPPHIYQPSPTNKKIFR